MTDKEEAIERLNNFKTIKVLYGNTFAMHLEQLKQLQSDIETVLNLIQTQQTEIDSLKDFKEIAESKVTDLNLIGLARTNQLLSRQCHKLQEESEKKDKIIDEMAKYWQSGISYCEDCDRIIEDYDSQRCETCIKEYFKKKVEDK